MADTWGSPVEIEAWAKVLRRTPSLTTAAPMLCGRIESIARRMRDLEAENERLKHVMLVVAENLEDSALDYTKAPFSDGEVIRIFVEGARRLRHG